MNSEIHPQQEYKHNVPAMSRATNCLNQILVNLSPAISSTTRMDYRKVRMWSNHSYSRHCNWCFDCTDFTHQGSACLRTWPDQPEAMHRASERIKSPAGLAQRSCCGFRDPTRGTHPHSSSSPSFLCTLHRSEGIALSSTTFFYNHHCRSLGSLIDLRTRCVERTILLESPVDPVPVLSKNGRIPDI